MSSVKFDRHRSRVGQFFSKLFHGGRSAGARSEAVPVCFQKRAYVYRRWPERNNGSYPPSTTLN